MSAEKHGLRARASELVARAKQRFPRTVEAAVRVAAQAGEASHALGRFGRRAAVSTAATVTELAQNETVRGAVRTGALTALDRMMTPPAEQTPVKDQVRDALRHGRRAAAHHVLTGEAPDSRRR